MVFLSGRLVSAIIALMLCLVLFPPTVSPLQAAEPMRLHPRNPKYFLFRGKPLALITATEHYGSVVNADFDFDVYLEEAADKKQTLTRLFLLFRELQHWRNPYSPIKPETPFYLTPFLRTGADNAIDGEPKYDLDQWNPAYFERLHSFLRRASELGIVVEVTLFSNSYSDTVWGLNPFHSKNNINNLKAIEWPEYLTLTDPELFRRQSAYVRKVIREINHYDNIYYEICNEPGGGVKGHSSVEEVDRWQTAISKVIREEMAKLPDQHAIFGSQAFGYTPRFIQRTDAGFKSADWEALNVHPLPNTHYGGKAYEMGNFMSKELKLAELRDYCLATYHERRPMVMDEDNIASMYRDDTGWTIHRKRAWTALMNCSHYDYIDFSIIVGREAGTRESRRKIRSWMKHLSEFFHALDFINSKPLANWVQEKPTGVVESVLSFPNDEYVVYLADGREFTNPASGSKIEGSLKLPLPSGTYQARLYSPVSGLYSPAMKVESQKSATVNLPAFEHDLVVHLKKH